MLKDDLISTTGVFILLAALLFIGIGDRPLRNPDEGRYAQIAMEMTQSHDWVRPTVFGLGYFAKPPLFYWLISGSFHFFGESEAAARCVPAVFALFTVLAVFFFCRRFFDHKTALFSALILGSNLGFIQVGRYLIIDTIFSFFLVLALFLFYRAIHASQNKNGIWCLFFISLALAMLAKGLAAIALVGLSAFAYLMVTHRFRRALGSHLVWGSAIFLLLVLPWFLMMEHRDPGFLQRFFWREHFQRFVSKGYEHQEPWYFYLVLLPTFLFPWSLLWSPLRQISWDPKKDPSVDARIFLLVSSAAVVLFYSLSRSKLATYLLPCIPLTAIVIGDAWKKWTDSKPKLGFFEQGPAILFILFSLTVLLFSNGYILSHLNKYPKELSQSLQLLAAVGIIGSVLCFRSVIMKRPGRLFGAWVFTLCALNLILPSALATMNPLYSTKVFAKALKSHIRADETIYVYDHPGPFYDFPFYLKKSVKLVGLEGELEVRREDARASEVSISKEDFFARVRADEKLSVIMRMSDFMGMDKDLREHLKILKVDQRKVLASAGGNS